MWPMSDRWKSDLVLLKPFSDKAADYPAQFTLLVNIFQVNNPKHNSIPAQQTSCHKTHLSAQISPPFPWQPQTRGDITRPSSNLSHVLRNFLTRIGSNIVTNNHNNKVFEAYLSYNHSCEKLCSRLCNKPNKLTWSQAWGLVYPRVNKCKNKGCGLKKWTCLRAVKQ